MKEKNKNKIGTKEEVKNHKLNEEAKKIYEKITKRRIKEETIAND